jgi:sterol desaturase/sphingolipid hydroxylase (fatty acid hydroxylase superfamily)
MSPLGTYSLILAGINYPFVAIVEWHASHHRVKKVFAVPAPADQRSREIGNALLTTPIHALLFFAAISSGLLKVSPESFPAVLSTFVITFLWTEVWHYASHVAFHRRSLHFIHREHHKSHLTGPWTSASFSLLEKLIFSAGILGGLACISRTHPLSMLGIFAYYIVYFFTNVLGHSNVEFRKPGYYRRLAGKIFNSPTYHALHHARYVRNYGLLTPWLDNLFGTAWPDVADVQSLVAAERPLARLGERLKR